MARRLGGLIGAAALLLALARMARLVEAADTGTVAWPIVLAAAAVLGGVVTWVATTYRLTAWAAIPLHLLGMALALVRVTVPDTLRWGLVPTSGTLPALAEELGYGLEVIRFGAAPVLPVAGLIGILTVVFWALGATIVWGVATGPRWAATLPPVAFYLQLAILDRRPPGPVWTIAGLLIVVAALLVTFGGSDPDSGRARSRDGRYVPRRSAGGPAVLVAATMAMALLATSALAATVPESGLLQWRSQTGFGTGAFGGTSLNQFVSLQQQVVSLSNERVFVARLSESAEDAGPLYWHMLTLDQFDGVNWTASGLTYTRTTPGDAWEREEWAFAGPTVRVSANIRIEGLRGQLLPVLYSPDTVTSDNDLMAGSFRGRQDGAVKIDVTLREGWEYGVVSEVPVPDSERLASIGDTLSPIFQEAAEAGAFLGSVADYEFAPRPDSIRDDFLELPGNLDPEVRLAATRIVADGVGVFEQALLLERWFRDSGEFTYSTDVSTGHSSLDLADWLLDPDSPNYRTGYCEQFAASMAVMARAVGIPSRVVLGFTPGETQEVTGPDGQTFDVVVVRENNAHAWVELWMDGQGWVPFDPTPRSDGVNPSAVDTIAGFDPVAFIPGPDEPGQTNDAPTADPANQPGIDEPQLDLGSGDIVPFDLEGTGPTIPTWLWVLLGLGAAVTAVPGFKWMRRRRRLRRVEDGDVSAAWYEIVDQLVDLGVPVRADLTPVEFASATDPSLVRLAHLYTESLYAPEPRPQPDAMTAFSSAESRIRNRYQVVDRLYARLRPQSLRRDR